MRIPVFRVSDHTNRAVQPQKMVSDLEVEGLYYLCSKNKGTNQLCGYRAADLCLCFRICKKQNSHDAAHM